ncbi:MAG: hypothetical protein ABI380_13075, partial [Edaphobacter sp.]
MLPSRLAHLPGIATLSLLLLSSAVSYGQRIHSFDAPGAQTASLLSELQREVRADMAFLADDELHGRGSATRDEHIAALFAASQFQSLGLEPGGDNGTFLQKAPLPNPLPANVQQRL